MAGTNPQSRDSRYLVMRHDVRGGGYFIHREKGTHDYLLIYTLGGGGLITHAEGFFYCAVHDVILLEPDHFHRYEIDPAAAKWEQLWAHFVPLPTWRAWLDWPRHGPGARRMRLADPRRRQRVIERLEEANRIINGYSPHREPLALNAVEAALLWCDEANPNAKLAALDGRVREAMDLICRHLEKPLAFADLARQCSLSPSRLAHLFKDQVGLTPHEFLDQQRLRRAKQLLEHSALTISEVAYAVGFNDPFYFSTRFKRETGQRPLAYRQAFRRG